MRKSSERETHGPAMNVRKCALLIVSNNGAVLSLITSHHGAVSITDNRPIITLYTVGGVKSSVALAVGTIIFA